MGKVGRPIKRTAEAVVKDIRRQTRRKFGFEEKIRGDGKWVNGGFFVCNQEIFDHLEGDNTIFERDPLTNLAEMGELSVWQHDGFWAAMDSMRDRTTLEELWASGDAPWKTW